MKIEGRTFLISGGASGLGQATARMIVRSGGNVAVLDVNPETGKGLVDELGQSRSIFITVDVTDSESIAYAVSKTIEWVQQTGYEMAGVIAAAGVANPAKILSNNEPFDLEGFDFVMSVNVRGTVDLTRQCLPYLSNVPSSAPDGERGVIIMVSSSAAFEGQPGQVSYSASKGAILSMTLPMTRDLSKYGIRVITLAPSLFDSGMTSLLSDRVRSSLTSAMEWPLRPGTADEFASLVKHSIENTMLNGETIRLSGGMRMPSKM